MGLSLALAIPLGIITAIRRASFIDYGATAVVFFGTSMPVFWTGIMLILLFAVQLRVLPVSGWESWAALVLPAFTLATFSTPLLLRIVRSSMLEVINLDYVRTARAKGVSEWFVICRHALINAALPLVTVAGLQFGLSLGGAIVTETVFAVPGLGRLVVGAIRQLDFPIVQAGVFVLALIVVLVNFAVDMPSVYLTPQIRVRCAAMAIGPLAPPLGVPAGAEQATERSRTWRKLARNPAAIAGALILCTVIGAAVFAPWIAPHEPARQSLIRRFTPPVWAEAGKAAHILGTDQVGRDILSRIIHGARISLMVGIAAVGGSVTVGVTLGLLSGFLQGRVDTVIMTVVDVTLSFPPLLLALAFVAALGPSVTTIIVVLGLTGWERYTRVVRAEVLALREKDFIEAARARGPSSPRMVLRHVLPNTFSSIIVMSTLQVAQAILQEAALSFLGVGTGSAYPTWGQMISLGRDFVSVAWWLPTFPGLAILVTVLAINLLDERLRDALDPRVGEGYRAA